MNGCHKLISLIVIVTVQMSGRVSAQPYYFNHYQVENGLSNNSVECSIQDDDGFLWFGTINGLNRFDGYTFKTFYNDPGDSTSIGSNLVRCLYTDTHGIIWVWTNKAVYPFNTISEKFKPIPSLPKGNTTQIISDAKGSFWVIINSSVYSYQPETGKVKLYP